MSGGGSPQQAEGALNLVREGLTSGAQPTPSQLEQIAEFTNSSSVDQDALCSHLFDLRGMSHWEYKYNALRIILYCVATGSEGFRDRAKGNTLWLIGVLLRSPEVRQEAAARRLFIQQHLQQFVVRTHRELTDDLDLLVRTIQDQRNVIYHESIEQANRLMQPASVRDAYSNALLWLQQSYNILHTVTLLAFKPTPADTRVTLQAPATIADLLLNLIHCVSHVNGNSDIRKRVLEACGDDAQYVMYGLQTVLDTHARGLHSSPRAPVLRLLQDLSNKTGLLPKDYWLSEIEEGERIGSGGEASIFKGVLLKNSKQEVIVLRKVHHTTLVKIILREAITHRQLMHPNILRFLGVYKPNSPPMAIVSPWVPNGDALGYVRQHSSPDCFMQITLGLGSAVAYIHSLDPPVIHGDIRAENVLIDMDGNPQLSDFGLSRIKHETTRTYTSISTAAYLRHMAPELSEDPEFRTTPQSDVFSFAMTIYELGTKSKPFDHKSALGATRLIQDGIRPKQPLHLADLTPSIGHCLWALVVQMWDHDPGRRPPAASVNSDLQDIEAKRRTIDSTSTPSDHIPETPHVEATKASTVQSILASLASTHISSPPTSEHTHTSHIPTSNPVNTPQRSEQSQIWSVVGCETLRAHIDKVISVAYAPNRNEFASGSNSYIRIWAENYDSQGASWSPRYDWGISHLACLSYTTDGALLAAGSYHDIKLWDTNTGESKGSLKGHAKFVTALAPSPDNNTMASGSKDKCVLLWDTRTKAKIARPLVGHAGMIASVAFSPGGEIVASASSDKTLRLWDIRVGRCISRLSGFADKVTTVSFSPNGRYIAAASEDWTIQRWNPQTLDPIGPPLLGHQGPIRCLAFSPDSTQIASGSVDMMIRIWDASTGTTAGSPLEGHTGTIESIAFSPNRNRMLSGSRDKTVKIWSAER